jgi:hypothetical protein
MFEAERLPNLDASFRATYTTLNQDFVVLRHRIGSFPISLFFADSRGAFARLAHCG